MIIRMLNPRGRVVEINNEEENIDELVRRGFVHAPTGSESDKKYNPVYDGGDDNLLKMEDTRPVISIVMGDELEVREV